MLPALAFYTMYDSKPFIFMAAFSVSRVMRVKDRTNGLLARLLLFGACGDSQWVSGG